MARVLSGDPQLADWQRRYARDQAIIRVVREALPRTLSADIAVADAESAELKLGAPSGAFAAVVRQRGADVLSALARKGWEFTAIKVVVQPRNMPSSKKKSSQIQWDAQARKPLTATVMR